MREQGTELDIQEIQRVELALLLHFRDFCDQHGLRFFLCNGTLLGAVKYGGFIPWDDDVDVMMPRADFDRLLRIYRNTPSHRLYAWGAEKNADIPFAKLCDCGTWKDEHLGKDIRLGLDIDIFPLDAWPGDYAQACRHSRRISRLVHWLILTRMAGLPWSPRPKALAKKLISLLGNVVGRDWLCRRIHEKATAAPLTAETQYVGCAAWCVYGQREVIPAAVFADAAEGMFEAQRFPIPVGYDDYLKSLYGDYRRDPPPERQKTHHDFKAYRL